MKRKLFPLVLLPVLALSACGEIRQEPTAVKENNPLVDLLEKEGYTNDEVYNNLVKIIYDAKLENGTIAKNVLDDVLLELAKSVYGDFDELKALAAKSATDTEVTNFITAHKVYQSVDKEDNRIANDGANEFTRLKLTAKRIEDRIANKFFDAIKGNYTRDGLFFEEDYLMSLRNSLKNVKKPDAQKVGAAIPPEFDGKDVFTGDPENGIEPLLHLENYKNKEKGYDYYDKDIVPEVYRELLVEQYLFESTYSTIQRAYARKVEIVTIANREDDKTTALRLMNAYVDTFVNNKKEWALEPSVDIVATAWRGYGLTELADDVKVEELTTVADQASYLLHNVMGLNLTQYNNGVADEDPAFIESGVDAYFPGTNYGSIVKKLEKVKMNSKTTDSTIESDFTNNGEYTVQRGFDAKVVKGKQESFITNGWHIRNGGLSSLNEKARTRLFNIGVANALDNENYPDRFTTEGYNNDLDGENPYVAKINGHYFLKKDINQRPDSTDEKLRDMIWTDDAAGSYTIIEIKEAVSSSKLAKFSEDNYAHTSDFETMEVIAHEVAYEVAKGESYKSLSTKYWLEAADLKYHDDKILEYFQTNYPELFEE